MRSLRLDEQSGFTLLEVIIAMTIMVLAFAAIISVQSGGLAATEKTRQVNIVSMLARNKMIEMEYEIENKTFEEVKKEDGGDFPPPHENFRWTSEIKEVKFPALNLSGGGAQEEKGGARETNDVAELLTKLITNFLSKSVREVAVTIYWKRPTAEQKFTVSTLWVDLNHEFELTP